MPAVVNSHRMALSISTDQTVLWDQIRYSGEPSEFAWVLPIKPGAKVELASDAWFDVLDAATSPTIVPPEIDCSSGCNVASASFGCGDDAGSGELIVDPNNGVDIVSRGSAGPYEMVVLRSEDPDALTDWLDLRGYAISEDIEPVIETYVEEGFDFVALRLVPGAGIQQMRPVRVVQPGAVPVLPLRMVAAGAGARTAISLFVIGEGRYTTSNFIEGTIDVDALEYDFATGLSNYTELRDDVFDANAEQTFLVPFARKGALFRRLINPTNDIPVFYKTSNTTTGYTKMADAYVQQAFENGETSSTDCADAFDGLESDLRRVVNPCGESGECRAIDHGKEIDSRTLACDPPIGSDFPLDDLAVAMTGMHPADVWVTRLDANLGRVAFGRDLELEPAKAQTQEDSFTWATIVQNSPCDSYTIAAKGKSGPTSRERARTGVALGLLAVASLVLGRRIQKLVKKGARS